MKKTIFYSFTGAFILCMTSCDSGTSDSGQSEQLVAMTTQTNGNLTRDIASGVLKSKVYLQTENIQLSNLSLSPSVPDVLKRMEEKGLATYQYIPPGNQGYGCYGQLTEKGKQYLHRVISNEFVSMVIAKIGFEQITGIQENPQMNTATVEYIEKIIEVTPIGEVINHPPQLGATKAVKAKFVKYDDGWRIKER